MTLDIIIVTKILSDRGTNALGDFEVQYMYDPRGTKPVEKWDIYCRNTKNKMNI